MNTGLSALMVTAIANTCLHTLSGPDHYVPFIAISRARQWSVTKTILWTMLCGLGHVSGSIILGVGAIVLGWSMSKIGWFDAIRGGFAGWALLTFGFLYALWGLWRAHRNAAHKHFDVMGDEVYVYAHKHGDYVKPTDRKKVTPFLLFIIFAFGPCEPLIPLMAHPAASASYWNLFLLVSVFTLFTLATMVTMVLLGYFGFPLLRTERIEKYLHFLGGITIMICGAGMVFLGW
ncbi:Cytochrome C biogenesis protein transmembrane region [Chitinophaga costaii]|uniref:Cytochrome C biogenesis protein transmembrane region n=1 Tax=Chitinophaga costaii TaxID=1335309 RepID=A0A1C4AQ65_9BACT|nr:sulfite exporter TauE/SafE family protein [Chitinophaga costaii]PUZ26700.1 hypothetical protein DCM91_09855 [Chitinophaga costaii]SCB96719.1 Cytochrome C biogenesis protein transmembrane region [Chitinophaga costaii]